MLLTPVSETVINEAVARVESDPSYLITCDEARAIALLWQPRGNPEGAMSRVARGEEFDPRELLSYVDETIREQDVTDFTGPELLAFRPWAECAVRLHVVIWGK